MQISGVSAGYGQYGMNQSIRKPPSMEEKFSEVDSDGDSSVSFEEFSADIESMQDKMSSGEMPPPPPGGGGNGGPPSMSSEDMEEMFGEADTDGDGVLSSDEFSSHMESLRPDPGVMQQMAGGGTGVDTDSFDADQILMDMMDSDDDDSEQSSISSYTNQMLQSYGLSNTSQTSSVSASSSLSSLLNVSA